MNQLNTLTNEVNHQIDKTQQQTLESSRNIRRLAEQSEQAGVHTLAELDRQRENLNKAETKLENIDNQLDEAEEGLEHLGKCCGLCLCPWTKYRRRQKQKRLEIARLEHDEGVVDGQPRKDSTRGISGNDVQLKRIVEDDHREDEINANVRYANKAVSNLAFMANEMGAELTTQNKQLDRINKKATANDGRLHTVVGAAQQALQ